MSDEDWNPSTKDALRRAGGSKRIEVNASLYHRTLQTASVSRGSEADANEEAKIAAVATGHLLAAFKPTDEVEGMFAAQAVMLHNLSMEAGRRAMIPAQPADIASKLRKDAANSARAFGDMVDALARYRGKGPQVVRVERVVVNEGGQAIVGSVSTASLPTSAPAPRVVGSGPAPMPVVEAVAVHEMVPGEGER